MPLPVIISFSCASRRSRARASACSGVSTGSSVTISSRDEIACATSRWSSLIVTPDCPHVAVFTIVSWVRRLTPRTVTRLTWLVVDRRGVKEISDLPHSSLYVTSRSRSEGPNQRNSSPLSGSTSR